MKHNDYTLEDVTRPSCFDVDIGFTKISCIRTIVILQIKKSNSVHKCIYRITGKKRRLN